MKAWRTLNWPGHSSNSELGAFIYNQNPINEVFLVFNVMKLRFVNSTSLLHTYVQCLNTIQDAIYKQL